MRSLLITLLGALAAASSSGCLTTNALLRIGLRVERPVTKNVESGPVVKAFSDAERTMLSLKYHVKVAPRYSRHEGDVEQERWINLTSRMLTEALSGDYRPPLQGRRHQPVPRRWIRSQQHDDVNIHRAAPAFIERCVSRREKWKTGDMIELKPHRVYGDDAWKTSSPIGIQFPKLDRFPEKADDWIRRDALGRAVIYVHMNIPATEGEDVVALELPTRDCRAGWAIPFMLLMPATIAFDVVTFPIQIPVYTVMFIAGLAH